MPVDRPRRAARLAWLALISASLPIACGVGERGIDPGRRGPMILPRLDRIAPGAEVGQGPPEGWTHRVVRSVPRLASGDLESLPESAGATASLFRTVILAEVVAPDVEGDGARLARIGVGNAVPVGDRELVVSAQGPPEAMEVLGVADRVVLIAAEARLNQGRLIARSPTFALLRAPTILEVEGSHLDVDLHYALLVDPETGHLTTLCWPRPEGDSTPPEAIVRLAPDLSFEAALDARITRRIGPAPVSWSFAMTGLPPGDPIPLGDLEASILVAPASVDQLERALRALAGQADDSRQSVPDQGP